MALDNQLVTIKQASEWATDFFKKNITPSNISYLIQYGRVKKIGDNGETLINKSELIKYYSSFYGQREISWKDSLGNDLNWHLSFDSIKEAETTKHVHRLHPYKGKFIPHLVQYFIDDHIDEFKKKIYFKNGDIILDPFCGSGTALVQANESGLHAIGIDISEFNSLISNAKIQDYNFSDLNKEISIITEKLQKYVYSSNVYKFEKDLLESLYQFNNKYFPAPEFRRKVYKGEINEAKYSKLKEEQFLPIFDNLIKKHAVSVKSKTSGNGFLGTWCLDDIRKEIKYVYNMVEEIKNKKTKEIIMIILSRFVLAGQQLTLI